MAYRDNHLSDREYRSSGRKAGAEKKQFRHTSDMEYRKSKESLKTAGSEKFSGKTFAERTPDRRPLHRRSSETVSSSPSYRDYEYSTSVPEISAEDTDSNDKYILTGRNPIREALKNNRDLEKLLVQKGELSGSAMEIVKTAKDRKILVQVVEKSRLDEISPHHQGLIAFASAFRYSSVEDILKSAEDKGEEPFLILLDGITDPHNLGAIIRSAECTGAHGIIVPVHRSVGLTPAAVKSSAGAVEYIPIARVTNLNRTIEDLQKKHIWVYALSMDGTDYDEVSFTGGTAVVIGAEGTGISRLTEEKCDMTVSLPMKGHLDSLNASVAAGVIMYRIMSSRRESER